MSEPQDHTWGEDPLDIDSSSLKINDIEPSLLRINSLIQEGGEEPDPGLPFVDWMNNGLLWLVNTQVFHPYGKTLQFHFDNHHNVIGWSVQSSSEPWTFPDTEEIHIKARRAMEFMRGMGKP